MPKAAADFTKNAPAQKTYARETAALAAVLAALAGLDARSQSFVWETAGQRLGLTAAQKPPVQKTAARKPVDKTHWYSDKEPFGPRNLDC